MRLSLESDRGYTTWRVPECPFRIEWPAAVLAALCPPENAVPDAGGLLWGTCIKGIVRILATHPLNGDGAALQPLLDRGRPELRARGLQPVGWYCCKTSGPIALSLQEQGFHDRYFPRPWQVALALCPTCAAFFFRGADGALRTEASDAEFELQPLCGTPAPGQIDEVTIPEGLALRRRRKWLWWAAALLMVGTSGGLYRTDRWRPPSASLTTHDLGGELQIRWNPHADPVRAAQSGVLRITEGVYRSEFGMATAQLRDGAATYFRTGPRVDVHLVLGQPDGRSFEEVAIFVTPANVRR